MRSLQKEILLSFGYIRCEMTPTLQQECRSIPERRPCGKHEKVLMQNVQAVWLSQLQTMLSLGQNYQSLTALDMEGKVMATEIKAGI